MSEILTNDILNGSMPSVFPSQQELEAWNSLSREEQVKRFQSVLNSSECNTASDLDMEDIKKRALTKLALIDK